MLLPVISTRQTNIVLVPHISQYNKFNVYNLRLGPWYNIHAVKTRFTYSNSVLKEKNHILIESRSHVLQLTLHESFPLEWPQNAARLSKIGPQHQYGHSGTNISRNKNRPILRLKSEKRRDQHLKS